MAIGVRITPPKLDDDRVRSTTGLISFGSGPEKVGCSVVNIPSVNFGAILLSLAGSFEGGATTDVFADNLFALGDSVARSSSEVVVVLSCILGLLVLFYPACFVELCWLCDFEFVSFGMSALNLKVPDVRLLLSDMANI